MAEVDWLGEGLKYFGLLVAAGGGTSAVVFGVFQSWGKGWLDSHFNKRLEEFKHEQTKEIERIKAELNTAFDRVQRLHQWEFDALPELWRLANEAYFASLSFSSPFRFTDDVKSTKPERLAAAMRLQNYPEHHIESVLEAADRQKEFERVANVFLRQKADSTQRSFDIHFKSKKIFIDESLYEHIKKINDLINNAISEGEMNYIEIQGERSYSEHRKLRDHGRKILDELGSKIKERLSFKVNINS